MQVIAQISEDLLKKYYESIYKYQMAKLSDFNGIPQRKEKFLELQEHSINYYLSQIIEDIRNELSRRLGVDERIYELIADVENSASIDDKIVAFEKLRNYLHTNSLRDFVDPNLLEQISEDYPEVNRWKQDLKSMGFSVNSILEKVKDEDEEFRKKVKNALDDALNSGIAFAIGFLLGASNDMDPNSIQDRAIVIFMDAITTPWDNYEDMVEYIYLACRKIGFVFNDVDAVKKVLSQIGGEDVLC